MKVNHSKNGATKRLKLIRKKKGKLARQEYERKIAE